MKKHMLPLRPLAAAAAVCLVLACTGAAQMLESNPLRDMDSSWEWAYGAASYLVNEGIIEGFPDGTFRPGDFLSRAQLVTMLVRSLGLEPEMGQAPFADTGTHWVDPFLQAAVLEGIVEPAQYGTHFRPDEEITRAEIARLIVRAMGRTAELTDSDPSFEDVLSLPETARAYIAAAAAEGIIIGYDDGLFRPDRRANRAEAAIMIHRMLLGEISGAAVDLGRLLEDTAVHPVAGYWPVELEDNHFVAIADDAGAVFPHVIVGLDAALVTVLEATSSAEQEPGRFAHVGVDELAPDVQERFPLGIYVVSFAFEDRSTSHVRIPEGLEGPAAAVQRMARVHPERIEELPSHWSLTLAGGARLFWSKGGALEPDIIIAFSANDVVFEVPEQIGPGGVQFLSPEDLFELPPEFSEGVYVISGGILR